MRKSMKNLFKEIQGVSKKGTVVILCIILTSLLVLINCSKPDPIEKPLFTPTSVTPILIGKGNLHGGGQEGIPKQNTLIKTSQEWKTLLNSMDLVNNISNTFAETDIDFSQYQVIAIFDWVKSNGGWTVDILDITEYADSIVVNWVNLEKGDATCVITQPFHIVKIPITNKKMLYHEEGEVPYKPCPCDSGASVDILHGEVYLFKDYIPQGINYQTINAEVSGIQLGICVLVFNSETEEAYLTPLNDVPEFSNPAYFRICNFPDFAKEWTIPENGCRVYLEGKLYENCGGITLGTHLDYLLTHLKKVQL